MASLETSIARRLVQLLRGTALTLLVAAGIGSIIASGGGACGGAICPEAEPPPGPVAPMSVFPQRYTFGGEPLPVTVRLAQAVPAGATAAFTVSTTLPAGAFGLPAGLTIPAGSSELTFNLATGPVGEFVNGRIDVTWTNYDPGTGISPLTGGQPTTLMPEPSSIQLSFTPSAVPGGQSSTLQVGASGKRQPVANDQILPWLTGSWIGNNHQFEFYGDGRVRRSGGGMMTTKGFCFGSIFGLK